MKPGMSDAELQQIMGAPDAVTTPGADTVWIWIYRSADPAAGLRSVRCIVKDRKVVEIIIPDEH